jgi:uncharacterized membrane protein YGL010W
MRMRTVQNWLDEYGESHRNPTNKLIHWICVPLIMLSLLGLLLALPRPTALASVSPYANWATLVILASLIYYCLLSPRLGAGMLIVTVLIYLLLGALVGLPWPLWATCAVIFAGAWIGQFIGHKIEGKKPSFVHDLVFLLIGPAWLMHFVYRKLGIGY